MMDAYRELALAGITWAMTEQLRKTYERELETCDPDVAEVWRKNLVATRIIERDAEEKLKELSRTLTAELAR